jgi:hypothetical protein
MDKIAIVFRTKELPPYATSNSLRAHSRGEPPPMRKTTPKSTKAKARCAICHGSFGLIRYRFELKQFCSKQCLDRYLARRKDQPTSLKQWIDMSRK